MEATAVTKKNKQVKVSLTEPAVRAEVQRLRGVGNYSRALELLQERFLTDPADEWKNLWKETFLERVDHLVDRGHSAEAAQRATATITWAATTLTS